MGVRVSKSEVWILFDLAFHVIAFALICLDDIWSYSLVSADSSLIVPHNRKSKDLGSSPTEDQLFG